MTTRLSLSSVHPAAVSQVPSMSPETCPSLLDRLLPAQPRLPLWLKLVYTGFLAVLVPTYSRDYGPINFLYFCDVALFFTLAALWLESPLLASTPLIGIFLPQMLWVVDFFFELAGAGLIGMTHYMFEPERRLFTRLLSLFHFWLPFLLLGLVWRLGYDRRALPLWTVFAWALMGICYTLVPPPPRPPGQPNQPANINYVYGLDDNKPPQDWLDPDWYFTLLIVALPLVIFLPSHWLFAWLFTKKPTIPGGAWASSP
jgi:hypothetical protein